MEEEKSRVTQQEHVPSVNVDIPVTEDEPDSIYQVGWRTVMAIVALAMSNNCAAISNTTGTIISFQIQALGDPSLASWIANSSLLATLAFGPVFGSLGDRFGKKWFLFICSIIGVVGSVVSGSAHRTTVIVVGNTLTGIANAGCIMGIPASQEVTPNKLRPWAMGCTQAFASSCVITGILAAGAFVKYQSWRWSYYLNAFCYGTSATLVFLFYHPPPTGLRRQQSQIREILSKVDYFGIAIFTGSIAALIIGLTWGGNAYPWSSGKVIACLVVGCAGLVGFGLYEWIFTSEGIFDHRLFENRNFPILIFVCLIDGMLLLGVQILYAQQIADMFASDAVKIATILTPFLATSAFGCIPAGMLMSKTRSYRVLLVCALMWCTLWCGLMALLNDHRLSWSYGFSSMLGIGTAVTTVIPVTALGLSVPSFLLGTAGTIAVASRALGGIVGITIFTAVYNNKIGAALTKDVGGVLSSAGKGNLTAYVVAALRSSNPKALDGVQGLPQSLIPSILSAQQDAQAYSWKFVWIALCCVIAANTLLSCASKSVANRMNDHVESALEVSELRDKQMTISH